MSRTQKIILLVCILLILVSVGLVFLFPRAKTSTNDISNESTTTTTASMSISAASDHVSSEPADVQPAISAVPSTQNEPAVAPTSAGSQSKPVVVGYYNKETDLIQDAPSIDLSSDEMNCAGNDCEKNFTADDFQAVAQILQMQRMSEVPGAYPDTFGPVYFDDAKDTGSGIAFFLREDSYKGTILKATSCYDGSAINRSTVFFAFLEMNATTGKIFARGDCQNMSGDQ